MNEFIPDENTSLVEAERVVSDAYELHTNMLRDYEGNKGDAVFFSGLGALALGVGAGLSKIPESRISFATDSLAYLYNFIGVGGLAISPILGVKAVIARKKLKYSS